MVIMYTLATLFSGLCPVMSAVGHPFTMVYPSVFAAVAFGLSYLLPEPGLYLPRAIKLSQNVTLLKLETEQVFNESYHYPVIGQSATYSRTYIEKVLGVERPRLNDTSIDPDILKNFSVDCTRIRNLRESLNSQSIKKWDWELGTGRLSTDPDERLDTENLIN